MCQEEFKLHRLKLNHPNARDFVESPWFARIFVLIYRVILAVYCSAFLIFTGFHYVGEEKWFIYLTNWGYALVTLYLILASALSLIYVLKTRAREDAAGVQTRGAKYDRADGDVEMSFPANETSDTQESMTWYHKAFWVIHVMAGTGSIVITLLYWIIIFRGSTDIVDISVHLFNSLFMVADTMLSLTPVRYLHFVYSCAFALAYGLFTVVYWAAGGTDPFDRSYIYGPINFEEYPGVAAGMIIGAVVVVCPLCHAILFGFFKLRAYLSTRYGRI